MKAFLRAFGAEEPESRFRSRALLMAGDNIASSWSFQHSQRHANEGREFLQGKKRSD